MSTETPAAPVCVVGLAAVLETAIDRAKRLESVAGAPDLTITVPLRFQMPDGRWWKLTLSPGERP